MFDLEHIARITGGILSGAVNGYSVEGISTDSRNISDSDLFVPLRGKQFDGHDYISQAVKKEQQPALVRRSLQVFLSLSFA